MKRKAIYGLFCLILTLARAACLSPSSSADDGKTPQPTSAVPQPNKTLPQQTKLLLQEAGFDIEYTGSSIKIENFENGKNGWHFAESSSAGPSDLYPSTGGISKKELEGYIKKIESGTLPALSELKDPEAYLRKELKDYLREQLVNYSDSSEWETGDITLMFIDKDGIRYTLSDQFLEIPE